MRYGSHAPKTPMGLRHTLMSTDTKFLFVTRFSLSKRSAIGIQTAQLMASCRRACHVFWEQRDIAAYGGTRLNSFLAARVARLRNGRIGKYSGLSWWRDDVPDAKARKKLARLQPVTAAVYIAPLDNKDAARMRAIVEALKRPFVLHLWDLLDGPPIAGSDLAWLLGHAAKVFCLAPSMIEAIQRPDAELLLFDRQPAATRATAPRDLEPFKIAIIGDVTTYWAGFAMLEQAVGRLNAAGKRFEIVFIGPEQVLKHLPVERSSKAITATGFLPTDEERDDALARCHAGFMPGPLADPTIDTRSQFSIPSKILDYMSVGLPIIGTTHTRSATAKFATELDIKSIAVEGSTQLEVALECLRGSDIWCQQSAISLQAYNTIHQTRPAQTLNDALVLLDQAK
jgi:hypothetical protein